MTVMMSEQQRYKLQIFLPAWRYSWIHNCPISFVVCLDPVESNYTLLSYSVVGLLFCTRSTNGWILFIYGISVIRRCLCIYWYTSSGGRMAGKWLIGMDSEGSIRSQIEVPFRCLSGGNDEDHEETQDNHCPGQYSNQAPLAYRCRPLPLSFKMWSSLEQHNVKKLR